MSALMAKLGFSRQSWKMRELSVEFEPGGEAQKREG